jgi:predicted DNA-binding transcriptional regulator YafY
MANRMSREEIIRTIKEAGRQRKVLWIRAVEKNGTIEPRECEPYSFRPKGTEKRFYFHCYLRNAIRNFLVDNILEVRITDKTFVPRHPVEF